MKPLRVRFTTDNTVYNDIQNLKETKISLKSNSINTSYIRSYKIQVINT